MNVDAISDLDLSYTPPLGSPWDAVQMVLGPSIAEVLDQAVGVDHGAGLDDEAARRDRLERLSRSRR